MAPYRWLLSSFAKHLFCFSGHNISSEKCYFYFLKQLFVFLERCEIYFDKLCTSSHGKDRGILQQRFFGKFFISQKLSPELAQIFLHLTFQQILGISSCTVSKMLIISNTDLERRKKTDCFYIDIENDPIIIKGV